MEVVGVLIFKFSEVVERLVEDELFVEDTGNDVTTVDDDFPYVFDVYEDKLDSTRAFDDVERAAGVGEAVVSEIMEIVEAETDNDSVLEVMEISGDVVFSEFFELYEGELVDPLFFEDVTADFDVDVSMFDAVIEVSCVNIDVAPLCVGAVEGVFEDDFVLEITKDVTIVGVDTVL